MNAAQNLVSLKQRELRTCGAEAKCQEKGTHISDYQSTGFPEAWIPDSGKKRIVNPRRRGGCLNALISSLVIGYFTGGQNGELNNNNRR